MAQSSGSQEPAGNHGPHAGRHHPGLTVPLNPPLLVLLLLALCRNPAPGPHTQELHCRTGLSPSIHSAGQSGLASSLGCKAPVGRPSVRVLTGWGPRWPTVAPSEASAQVCSGMSTHQASWGRGCPGPGSPRRQHKPGRLRCQGRGAAPCPPSSETEATGPSACGGHGASP